MKKTTFDIVMESQIEEMKKNLELLQEEIDEHQKQLDSSLHTQALWVARYSQMKSDLVLYNQILQ